jgi:anti-sigma factor RsiW
MSDDPDDSVLRLNAALDAMSAHELESDLRADPVLAAEYRRLETLRDATRRAAPREGAPKALADRIMTLTAPAAPPSDATVVPFRRPTWTATRALAASFAILGVAVGVGLTSLRTPNPSQDVAQSLVSDFARAEIAGQPYDVASSDRHTVKPWLAGRTTVSASIVDLAS